MMPRGPAVLVLVTLAAGCGGEPQTVRALLKQIDGTTDPAAKATAIERYIDARGGTPIVEQNSRLVFLVQDVDGQTPRILGDFNAWATTPEGHDVAAGVPTRIDGTSWSYLEGTGFTNGRLEYVLLVGGKETRVDPKNPRTVRTFAGPRSEVRMPFWTSHPEVEGTAAVPEGKVTQEAFQSRALKGSRRVWTYLPAGYDDSEDLYPTVYFLDGGDYADWMQVPSVLDQLIASGAIRPLIAVFVEPASRQEEYSRDPAWRTFMARELVGTIDKRHRTFPAPDHRVIFGSALSAYGAVDLAVEAPDVFGLCAAVAPPAQTSTLLTNQAQGVRAVHGVRFFVLGAMYDTDVRGARTLRTALEEAQADVRYVEVPEGHAAETFRGRIDDVLKQLVPPPA